jgi:hypothetical protein
MKNIYRGEKKEENVIFSGDRHMNASFIYSFYTMRVEVTALPAVRVRTGNQEASRKLIANAFRACSSPFIR